MDINQLMQALQGMRGYAGGNSGFNESMGNTSPMGGFSDGPIMHRPDGGIGQPPMSGGGGFGGGINPPPNPMFGAPGNGINPPPPPQSPFGGGIGQPPGGTGAPSPFGGGMGMGGRPMQSHSDVLGSIMGMLGGQNRGYAGGNPNFNERIGYGGQRPNAGIQPPPMGGMSPLGGGGGMQSLARIASGMRVM